MQSKSTSARMHTETEGLDLLEEAVHARSSHPAVQAINKQALFDRGFSHPVGWRRALSYLDAIEIDMVRRTSNWMRFRMLQRITMGVNLLGNGWIYLLICIALAMSSMPNTAQITLAALCGTGISHAIYALAKQIIARKRPFEYDPTLQPIAKVLDRYSFPSGHCMTLTVVLTPIVQTSPDMWPAALAALATLSWCRLAAAHHYPSDVLAGICLGAAVALPITGAFIPH